MHSVYRLSRRLVETVERFGDNGKTAANANVIHCQLSVLNMCSRVLQEIERFPRIMRKETWLFSEGTHCKYGLQAGDTGC